MMDLAKIGLRADSSELVKAAKDYDNLGTASKGASRNADEYAKEMDKAGTATSKMNNYVSQLLKPLAILTTALAGALSLRVFISASTEAERVQTQLAAAIRSTGGAAGQTIDKLNEHAAALQGITNYGDEAINSAQALLLTFRNIKGDEFERATAAVLDLSTAMGTDLNSSALQLGKALNDPILGMTALQRSGITFSQSQKDVIKEMVETNRVAEAQRLILDELAVQFGGSAEAARSTLGGALASLANVWGDLFELSKSTTEGLRLAIEDLITAIKDPAFFEFVQLIGSVMVFGLQAAVMAATLLVDTISFLSRNFEYLMPILPMVTAALLVMFGPAVLSAAQALTVLIGQRLVAAVLAFNAALLANPIALVVAAIVGVMSYMVQWEQVIQNLIKAWALFMYHWHSFWGDEAGAARYIEIGLNADKAVEDLRAVAEEIKSSVLGGFDAGSTSAGSKIEQAMTKGGQTAAQMLASAQNAAVARYEQMNGKAVKEISSSLIEGGKYLYNQVTGEVRKAGKTASEDISKGMKEGGADASGQMQQAIASGGAAAADSFEAAGVRLTGSVIGMFVLELKSLVTLQMQLIDAQIQKLSAEANKLNAEARAIRSGDNGGSGRGGRGWHGRSDNRGREIRIVEDYGPGWDPYRGRLLPGETAPAPAPDPAPPPDHTSSSSGVPNITNVLSPDNMLNVLDTAQGNRTLINVIKMNREEIAALLGST